MKNKWHMYDEDFAVPESSILDLEKGVSLSVKVFLNLEIGIVKIVAKKFVNKSGPDYYIKLFQEESNKAE